MFEKRRKAFIFTIVFLAIAMIPWVHFSPAIAAIITVTNTSDSGGGSLRQAIASAAPGDTINFSVTGTITLTSAELLINQNLNITGPGATSLAISGNNARRVFNITGGTVNIFGVTIQNGNVSTVGGAGILNNGILTLDNVAISGNSVSTTSGGGIYNGGTLTLTNSTVSGNSCSSGGGGIYNLTTATLTNVTFSNNSGAFGGGIINFNSLTLTNVTLTNNLSTAVPNLIGSGIYNFSGAATLRNTIVANNTGVNCTGTITSVGHNLDSANTCGFTGPGDLTNTNPLLGPLALNAPGSTQTHALLSGSPAIDKADPTTFPATDQRGVTRPQGAGPDIGAYEFAPLFTTSVPTMTEWGVIMLTVLLGIGAVYYLRRRRLAV